VISAAQALRRVLKKARPLPERLSRPEAGLVLSRGVRAACDAPAFANSTMDGFAVKAPGGRELALVGTSAAGVPWNGALKKGQAVRIMTGAPLPKGADAVVVKEWCRADGASVRLYHLPGRGDWVRRKGEDVRRGESLFEAGTRLGPLELGVLAGQGVEKVWTRRRPVAAVLCTGTEVARRGGLKPGQIRDANGPMILAALRAWGAETVDLGVAADDKAALTRALRKALGRADLVVVSGGVSVGDYDFTWAALKALGFKLDFWKASIKPGKPLLFGLLPGKIPVFGIPGNPASTAACLELFVRPALAALRGLPPEPAFPFSGRAETAFALPRERQQFLFCRAVPRGGGYALKIIKPQASHMLGRVGRADALAETRPGARSVKPGDRLAFRFLFHAS
jgi:molybdopterin molybdotransferase